MVGWEGDVKGFLVFRVSRFVFENKPSGFGVFTA